MPEPHEERMQRSVDGISGSEGNQLGVDRPSTLSEGALLGRRVKGESSISLSSIPLGLGDYRPLAGLFCGNAILITGHGLFQTLIPLRLLEGGASPAAIGIIQSCYFAGFMVGAVFNRRLIDRVGQHRTYVAWSAFVAILALAFGSVSSLWALACIRFFIGFAFMGLCTSMESWLGAAVPNAQRGRVFGTYAAINYLAMAAGQLLLGAGMANGSQQFLIVAVLFAGAVLPVSLLEGWPARVKDEALRRVPPQTWRVALVSLHTATPIAIPGCLLAGALYSAFYALMPVFLSLSDLSTGQISTFMSIALIGALLPQWPMGRLSDRLDRRTLVIRNSMVSSAVSLVLVILHQGPVLWILVMTYVAATFTQYGLIVSHVNDHTDHDRRVATSITLLVLYSLGGMTGTAMASALMSILGKSGIFAFNALCSCCLGLSAWKAKAAVRANLP